MNVFNMECQFDCDAFRKQSQLQFFRENHNDLQYTTIFLNEEQEIENKEANCCSFK